MGKNKLKRFAENKTFCNLFEPKYPELVSAGFVLKGKWHSDYFHNNNPIVVELGCGKGEFTIGLSQLYPNKNFIGIDRQGARLWKGCKIATEENIKNVAFLRTQIDQITMLFGTNEISEIWIPFPDPQPNRPCRHKRLTSPEFLNRYRQVCDHECTINLKTDSHFFYTFTKETAEAEDLEILYETTDLYASDPEHLQDAAKITTYYESMWLAEGLKINYMRYKLFSPNK